MKRSAAGAVRPPINDACWGPAVSEVRIIPVIGCGAVKRPLFSHNDASLLPVVGHTLF